MLTLDDRWSGHVRALPITEGGYHVVDVTLGENSVIHDCVVIDCVYLKPPQDAPGFTVADILEITASPRPRWVHVRAV